MYTTASYKYFEPESSQSSAVLTKSEINALLYGMLEPQSRDEIDYDNFMHVPLLPAVLGTDETDRIVYTEMDSTSPFLIGGLSGSGKSTVLYSMIDSLIYSDPKSEVYFVDLKALPDHKYRYKDNVVTINDADVAMAFIDELSTSVMKERYTALQTRGFARFGKAYEMKNDIHDIHPVFLAIDEFAEFVLADRRRFENAITRIAQRGGACGIYLICTTQASVSEIVTPALQTCFPSRICLRQISEESSKVILGVRGAEGLAKNRQMICRENGTEKPFGLCTVLTEDLIIKMWKREAEKKRETDATDARDTDSVSPNGSAPVFTPEQIDALTQQHPRGSAEPEVYYEGFGYRKE